MKEFIAIDFETANPQRVSACALGYAKVSDCQIIESDGFLIKPVGGHAPFQSKIHGIKEEHTLDKPFFDVLFPEIKDLFNYPLVGHSLFDKQVLNALSDHFDLRLSFIYIDSSAIAKERLTGIESCKLTTLAKHFGLASFKHHDATEDALTCANIFLKLCEKDQSEISGASLDENHVFKGLIMGILADDKVNYKEAFELLYWLEDHPRIVQRHQSLFLKTKEMLSDDCLDRSETKEIGRRLKKTLKELG